IIRKLIKEYRASATQHERRVEDRIDFVQPVKVEAEDGREFTLLSRDLSPTGIRLVGTKRLLGHKVRVHLPQTEGANELVFLVRELAFRTNFLVKITVEILWLSILLLFYHTVFQQTSMVADWQAGQYMFFVGYYFAMGGLMETLFLENCNQFADLVRTGDLDF